MPMPKIGIREEPLVLELTSVSILTANSGNSGQDAGTWFAEASVFNKIRLAFELRYETEIR